MLAVVVIAVLLALLLIVAVPWLVGIVLDRLDARHGRNILAERRRRLHTIAAETRHAERVMDAATYEALRRMTVVVERHGRGRGRRG